LIKLLFSGESLRIELRAESRFIGCLSTIVVFRLLATNPATSGTRFQDTLSVGDSVLDSKSPMVAGRTGHETTSMTTGQVEYVIRKVRVHFEDQQLADLRPKVPFKRPPRVSGKRATVLIEGLLPES